MPVTATTSNVQYEGNGAAMEFAVPFQIFDKNHCRVTVSEPGPDGTTLVDVPKAVDVDYAITGVGSGGACAVAYPIGENAEPLPAGSKITIWRETPIKQQSQFVNGEGYDANVMTRILDNLTHIVQENADQVSRAVRAGETAQVDGKEAYAAVMNAVDEAAAALAAAQDAVATANASDLKAAAALTTAEAAVGTAGNAVAIAESAVSTAGEAVSTAGEAFSAAAAAELKAAAAQADAAAAVATAGAVYELMPQALAAAEAAEDAATTATTAAQQALAAAHTHGNYALLASFAEESGRLYFGTTGTATAAEVADAYALAASKAAVDDAGVSTAGTWSSAKIAQALDGLLSALPPGCAMQIYTAGATWTAPADGLAIWLIVGGGGGGSSSHTTSGGTTIAGAGGGGGGVSLYAERVAAGAERVVHIGGAGQRGSTNADSRDGGGGGDSYVEAAGADLARAAGGKGGAYGLGGEPGAGGVGNVAAGARGGQGQRATTQTGIMVGGAGGWPNGGAGGNVPSDHALTPGVAGKAGTVTLIFISDIAQ